MVEPVAAVMYKRHPTPPAAAVQPPGDVTLIELVDPEPVAIVAVEAVSTEMVVSPPAASTQVAANL